MYPWKPEPQLVPIAGGSFLMGSESGSDDERPVHPVSLDSFQISRTTVTNQEFRVFLDATNHDFPQHLLNNSDFSDPCQPVTGVNWHDAIQYCSWVSGLTGHRYRLPTEAEWEYVATSGNPENIYPWGTRTWEERPELHHRFQKGPELAGSFGPNHFGVFDMGMNVHEWCMDWYSPLFYGNSPLQNPLGPNTGSRRSSRGGSWRHKIKITRCAARSSIPPQYRYADYGFRIVREL